MLLPITVHVPERRAPEFYIRFGEFLADVPDPEAPTVLPSGIVPTWVVSEEAPVLAAALMNEISGPGYAVLRHLIREARDHTIHLLPEQLAQLTAHPKGKSGVAGILGGVGKAIRRAGLPLYTTPKGASWHYVWDWDGERYSMTPEVARLLRTAHSKQGSA